MARLREGEGLRHTGLTVWRHAGRELGAKAISLRILESAPGTSPGLRNAGCDEVLYVLEGEGTILLDGWSQGVEPGTGIYVRPGVCLTVYNPGPEPLTMASSQCPDPGPALTLEPPPRTARPAIAAPSPLPIVHLWEQEAQITGDRWYRVLVGGKVGSALVTQFVGSIPPGRAPDHFHHYEEVLVILEGRGRMWAGETHCPLERGSCVFLPQGQVHCVENTGSGELRLLGIIYPAGSPAVRYSPD